MRLKEPIPAIDQPTVILVLDQPSAPEGITQVAPDATRAEWQVGVDTREKAVYALGVAGGVVRGAYRITGWQMGTEAGHWRFSCVPAPELGVLGTTVDRLLPSEGSTHVVRPYLDGVPPIGTKPVATIAHELNSEPLARIMYGQRELFHSNFLAWMFDELPNVADPVFRSLTISDTSNGTEYRHVEREHENLDLVLYWPGAEPLVIENKVFSLPEKTQLVKYRDKTALWKGTSPQHVLLSMSPPTSPICGWTYVSYQELAERIDLALIDVGDDSYEIETVRRYSRLIRLLSALLDTTVVRAAEESAWLDSTQLAEINSKQTQLAVRKLRARRVQAAIDDQGPTEGWTEAGISHGQPLVGWLREIRVSGVDIQAGWQYQGGQFRLCVVLHHLEGRSDEARSDRESFASSHPELFDFAPLYEILSSPDGEVRPRERFGHFAPNFVYRYVKAPDQTIEQLVEATHALSTALDLRSEAHKA